MSNDIPEGLPPRPPESEVPGEPPDIRSLEPSAMDVFFAWEKLRLLFNALYVTGLCYFVSGLRGGDDRIYLQLLFVVILGNGFFSSGPAIEGYLCWLRVPRKEARWVSVVVVNVACILIVVCWIHG